MANEKRLIDANALLDKVQFRLPIDNRIAEVVAGCVDITRRLIENAPTVDAVEVVHGRWIGIGGNRYTRVSQCSNCCAKYDFMSNYCPNCGTKMDGERKDNERKAD